MATPDQRLFEEDLLSAEFRIGVANGFWGISPASIQPENMIWPKVLLWIAAPPRPSAPDAFHIYTDPTGFRTAAPTGAFWNPATKTPLPLANWPKGKANTRLAKVFRTDWKGGIAFYHPYDRVAAQDHPDWRNDQPHLVWTPNHTIVDYLEEFHSLLNGEDYVGV
jgi:hypothetical protein